MFVTLGTSNYQEEFHDIIFCKTVIIKEKLKKMGKQEQIVSAIKDTRFDDMGEDTIASMDCVTDLISAERRSRRGGDVCDFVDIVGNNPLHIAARYTSCPNIAKAILYDSPQLLNSKNNDGITPLIIAALSGNHPMVEILLREGADPDIRGKNPVFENGCSYSEYLKTTKGESEFVKRLEQVLTEEPERLDIVRISSVIDFSLRYGLDISEAGIDKFFLAIAQELASEKLLNQAKRLSAAVNFCTAGVKDMEEEKYEDAYRNFMESIVLEPEYTFAIDSLNQLKITLLEAADWSFEKNDDESSKRYYEFALRIEPQNGEAHFGLGKLMYCNEQFGDALIEFEEVKRVTGESAKVLNAIGKALTEQGLSEDALSTYVRAIELDDRFASTYDNLGDLMVGLKRFKEASANFEKAQELYGVEAKHYSGMRKWFRIQGREQKADEMTFKAASSRRREVEAREKKILALENVNTSKI